MAPKILSNHPTNPDATLSAVAWDGRRFVAVGSYGVSAITTDGLTWAAMVGEMGTRALAVGPDTIVSVGFGAYSSADGQRWRYRAPDDPTGQFSQFGMDLANIVYAQGRFVAVGARGQVWVSQR
ncbi:MAG: hypothetical protein WAQ05_24605 [Rubrivivax sp.]